MIYDRMTAAELYKQHTHTRTAPTIRFVNEGVYATHKDGRRIMHMRKIGAENYEVVSPHSAVIVHEDYEFLLDIAEEEEDPDAYAEEMTA